MSFFQDVNVEKLLKIKGRRGYGASIAVARDEAVETYCAGSGRFGRDFPVSPEMMFQAGSVSKPMFALTLLRYVDKGRVDLDADLSDVLSDIVDTPVTFHALLSHTAGFNVHGFAGYRAQRKLLTLEDVVMGRGNSPKVKQTKPYGAQYCYSGGGITLAELAFTRLINKSLREAFEEEIALPLELKQSGFFQPLDESFLSNAAFGGQLGIWENWKHGYRYHPEHAAAGFWTTPTELVKIGCALSASVLGGGLLSQRTAERMVTPVKDNVGLCLFRSERMPDLAWHSGCNVGFMTMWGFSLTKNVSVAAMINRSTGSTYKALSEIRDALFLRAAEG